MKKTILICLIAVTCGLADNFADQPEFSPADLPHACRWPYCPYKGITPGNQDAAVREYTGCDEGTDGYCIDMLHFQYPEKDGDQLEDILFSKTDNIFEY
jgi:hypothetical protein